MQLRPICPVVAPLHCVGCTCNEVAAALERILLCCFGLLRVLFDGLPLHVLITRHLSKCGPTRQRVHASMHAECAQPSPRPTRTPARCVTPKAHNGIFRMCDRRRRRRVPRRQCRVTRNTPHALRQTTQSDGRLPSQAQSRSQLESLKQEARRPPHASCENDSPPQLLCTKRAATTSLQRDCPSLLFKNDLTVPKTTVRPTIDS
jgi:hypothetical protein